MNTIHTICIVDDDEEIRSLLSDYLRRNGFSTCTAGNAAEFLEMQRRVPCSLIVMDIMLPGMNGLELFRTLRAESTVPVIFLTALGDITDRIVGLELGADDYLSKPFEPRELLARIRTVLRRTEGGARRDQPETTPLQFAGWLLEAGLLILLILVVVHRMVRPLRVLSGKAESFGRNLYTAPLPEDGPTEVREAARAFNKMQERIRAGVGQHERILAAVAHDLRTPLTRIRLRVEGMDPASPLRAKLLGDIDILGGIMANSAELTRGSARDEAAVRMDMNALLDSLVSDRQDMGQDVMLEGHCRQPWTVRPNSLRRCLSNLLDNALRYSARVRIRLLEKADVLQIDVLDDGPGIPPEMLEQVFEPFFRLDEARSPHTGGSGLGLSIARSMACRNGGELSLHNRPEGGLCARLCLYRSAMETESL